MPRLILAQLLTVLKSWLDYPAYSPLFAVISPNKIYATGLGGDIYDISVVGDVARESYPAASVAHLHLQTGAGWHVAELNPARGRVGRRREKINDWWLRSSRYRWQVGQWAPPKAIVAGSVQPVAY